MCGIAGVAGAHLSEERLTEVAAAMRHRGPDGDGFFVDADDRVQFAFRRLAIVDLIGGVQPMRSEDGAVHVVFNGEIYDHQVLRRELESKGHRFGTDHSDTEVIVHGWEEWGEELFGRLNGMFAVAIWDDRAGRLVLARDRLGIKPLYYATLPSGELVFASEITPIHSSGLVPRRPSLLAVREYFAFQNVWGERTMFDGILQLLPGELLGWSDGATTRRRYWSMEFPRSRREPLAALADEHRDLLRRVVRRQIAADVPVTSYLSGGVDSTAITVAAHELDTSMTAFSCIFDLDGVGDDRVVDEREFSRLVAESYGLRRVEHVVAPATLATSLRAYVRALEDLRMGMGYPVFAIAGRVAEDARVVLSGTGGDEFHGGYIGRYASLGLTGTRPSLRTRLRRLAALDLATRDSQIELGYRRALNFLVPETESSVFFTPAFLAATANFEADTLIADAIRACPSTDWRDRILYVDATTYLVGLLALEDKLSMAHSLETRVPLLDNELVDFMLDVPFEALFDGTTGKVLFRESVRPWVPDEIFAKPKMGFGPPDASWYRGQLRPWIEERLADARVRKRGVVRPEWVRSTLEDHFSARRDATYQIWSLLCFDAWCDEFGFFA